MLVLGRNPGQSLYLRLEDGRRIRVMVCGIVRGQAKIGIEAAKTILIDRSERREHNEDEHCWCQPLLDFVAEDGTKHWIHHEPN